MGTTAAARRALESIKTAKGNAPGCVAEYFDNFATNLERFRIDKSQQGIWDELLFANLATLVQPLHEILKIFDAIGRYGHGPEYGRHVHRFFERLIPYFSRPPNVNSYTDTDFDNFQFFGRELFIHAIAAFVLHERFDLASLLLTQQYYCASNSDLGREVMVNYSVFHGHPKTFSIRNERLKMRRISPVADVLQERLAGTGVESHRLIQADFIAYLRRAIDDIEGGWTTWWPDLLVYLRRHGGGPFELFARAQSTAYFDNLKTLFGVSTPQGFAPLIALYSQQPQRAPQFDYSRIDVASLIGFDKLATRP